MFKKVFMGEYTLGKQFWIFFLVPVLFIPFILTLVIEINRDLVPPALNGKLAYIFYPLQAINILFFGIGLLRCGARQANIFWRAAGVIFFALAVFCWCKAAGSDFNLLPRSDNYWESVVADVKNQMPIKVTSLFDWTDASYDKGEITVEYTLHQKPYYTFESIAQKVQDNICRDLASWFEKRIKAVRVNYVLADKTVFGSVRADFAYCRDLKASGQMPTP